MGNLGEMKSATLIFDFKNVGGDEYVIAGGGVEPGVPLPDDTVNSNAIIDGAVHEEDLNDSVKDRMTITHDASTGGLRIGGYAKPGDIPANNSQDIGQGGGEDSDDDKTGFDTVADNGEGDI